jgi:hypothetical protein
MVDPGVAFQVGTTGRRLYLPAPRTFAVDRTMTFGVEPILIRASGGYYLGVGARHGHNAKPAFPSDDADSRPPEHVLGATVIPIATPLDCIDWRRTVVESYIDDEIYQAGPLTGLDPPAGLVGAIRRSRGAPRDFLLFCGTIAPIVSPCPSGSRYELYLQTSGGAIVSHRYTMTGSRRSVTTAAPVDR